MEEKHKHHIHLEKPQQHVFVRNTKEERHSHVHLERPSQQVFVRNTTEEKHNHVHLERPIQQVFVRKQEQHLHRVLLQKDQHFTQLKNINNEKHWNVRLERSDYHQFARHQHITQKGPTFLIDRPISYVTAPNSAVASLERRLAAIERTVPPQIDEILVELAKITRQLTSRQPGLFVQGQTRILVLEDARILLAN